MITKCILIYALLVNNFGYGVADEVMDLTDCDNYVPETCYQYATLLVEHFDEKNIETAAEVYPDWICRFYCDKNISNLDKLKTLAEQGKCELIVPDSPIFEMYWRYFAADDPNVSSVIFRDTDSLVNFREKAAFFAIYKVYYVFLRNFQLIENRKKRIIPFY